MKKIVFLLMLAALAAVAGVTMSSARVATPASALLENLPDGTAVALIDFQKITGSSFWTAINAQDKLKGVFDKAQSEMTDLGVKLSDIRTVAVVFPAGMDNPTVALNGGFERDDLLARLRASGKVKLTSEKYKDFEIFTAKNKIAAVPPKGDVGTKPDSVKGAKTTTNDETSFVFFDANTLVASNLDGVRASVDVKTGARPGITQNAKLTDALAPNPTAAIRFALAITPAMTSSLQTSEFPIPDFSSVTLIFGSIDMSSGIDLIATLRSDNAEHAKAISERLNGLLTMAKGFLSAMSDPRIAGIAEALKTVNIVATDADVRITGNLPMDLLTSLFSSSTKKDH